MKFRDDYYFLSNMFPCDISIDMSEIAVPEALRAHSGYGPVMSFPCSESAFQAAKCLYQKDMAQFTKLDGFKAKKAGRKVPLRPDWETVKVTIMTSIVKAKFDQHPELMRRLRDVKGEICEDNTWHDTFWGKCNGEGENNLGKILMRIRDGHATK